MKILETFSFEIVGQRGSHIKLARMTKWGKEVLTFPNHKALRAGTCKAIFNQATKFISPAELREYFYTK